MSTVTIVTTTKHRNDYAAADSEAQDDAARQAIKHFQGEPVTFLGVTEYVAADKYEGDITYQYDWKFRTRQ